MAFYLLEPVDEVALQIRTKWLIQLSHKQYFIVASVTLNAPDSFFPYAHI